MALIYRLSGDYNPLHADPKVARIAGYQRPILHGLATYGLACRALLETCCDGRVERLRGLDARFTAPVLPGDSIAVQMWRVGTEVAFRAVATERGVVVLDQGNARLD
jgi:acyl dehydratase